ncbi:response regulator transcription factor [Nitratifractor sp.]
MKILLIEDNEMASELIYNFLGNRGFDVTPVFTATDSISHIRNSPFDLVLLDINLPDYDGYEVLKSLGNFARLPVIVTSAFSDTESKLLAFKYGANDYMTKPLDLEELEARIWLQLKTHSRIETEEEEGSELFRQRGTTIFFKNRPLDLTTIEFDILHTLLQRKNQTVDRRELMETITSIGSSRSLDNHIKNIRKKLGDSGSNSRYLKTVYGVGYMLKT